MSDKQIHNLEELMQIVIDTADRYQKSIRHVFNNKLGSVMGNHELAKQKDPSFNIESFNQAFKTYEQFRDTTVVYSFLLKEYQEKPHEIPEVLDKDQLTQILLKYGKNINDAVHLIDDKPPYEKSVNKIVESTLNQSEEIILDLPFIQQLRQNSYPLQEARDQIVKDLGSLSLALREQTAYALSPAKLYGDDLYNITFDFLKLVSGLPKINYKPSEKEHEQGLLDLNL